MLGGGALASRKRISAGALPPAVMDSDGLAAAVGVVGGGDLQHRAAVARHAQPVELLGPGAFVVEVGRVGRVEGPDVAQRRDVEVVDLARRDGDGGLRALQDGGVVADLDRDRQQRGVAVGRVLRVLVAGLVRSPS